MKEIHEYEKSYIRVVMRKEKKKKRREVYRKVFSRFFLIYSFLVKIFSSLFKKVFSFVKHIIEEITHIYKKGLDNVHIMRRNTKKKIHDIQSVKKKSIKTKKTVLKKKVEEKKKNKKSFHFFSFLKKKKKEGRKKRKKNNITKILKIIFVSFFIITLIALSLFFFWFSSLKIPSVDNFKERKVANSTKIFDRTGKILLYDIHKDIRRTVIPGDKISPYAKKAIIAIEDHNFYKHHGVVWKSTIRAAIQTILSKLGFPHSEMAGGSTLTQQVVKNTLLTRQKTITRKIKEWILAYKLEKLMSKDEILTTYLNEAPYGGTIYGIQEASKVYFGKPASDLTIAEAAYLAAIPNLPTYYSPYGQHKKELDERQKLVLSKMREYGFISNDEFQKAILEKVHFLPRELSSSKAMHFVQYVRSLLEKKYGLDLVENGGLRVITTLNYPLQKKAEKIIKDHVEEVKKEDATNSALVAIESHTGDIITMVGSRDYFETKDFDGNFNVALSSRQPGSSFKPIAYATAFSKGFLPETAIFDVQTQFNVRCKEDYFQTKNGCYAPSNWDRKFKGPMDFRTALAQSRNIPAIKVMYLAGLRKVMAKAREMGITTLNNKASHYGLGLVLGGGEVPLLEMVSAYTTFSNEGIHLKPRAILEVRDYKGNVLYKAEKKENRVFDKNVARMISSILSDNRARTPLYGSHSYIYFGDKDVAGKTGTTDDKRDAWMIGYTTDVAAGVWTGNNDNTPMKKGSKLSMKPWRLFMDEVLKEYPAGKFSPYKLPDNFDKLPPVLRGEWKGNTFFTRNKITGKLATDNTPEELKEKIHIFDPHTILHFINKDDPQNPNKNGRNDPQYKNWEFAVQKYVHDEFQDIFDMNPEIPTEEDDGDYSLPKIIIGGLKDSYQRNDVVELEFDIDGFSRDYIEKVSYFLDGVYLGSSLRKPFNIIFDLSDISELKEGDHKLKVEVKTKNGIKFSKELTLHIDE